MNKILYHIKPGTTNFFLGEFPDKINYYAAGGLTSSCEFIKEDYDKALNLAKEEAIKNGEITNAPIHLKLKWVIRSSKETVWANSNGELLKDGDLFDLPEGLSVERMLQVRWGTGWHDLPNQKEGREQDGIYRTVIRLVPSNKEEEDLTIDEQETMLCEAFKKAQAKNPSFKFRLVKVDDSKPESQEDELDENGLNAWEALGNRINELSVLKDPFGVHPLLDLIKKEGNFTITRKEKMTLDEIQDAVAVKLGYDNYRHFATHCARDEFLTLWNEVCKRYAIEVAKASLLKASIGAESIVDREAITDESNIVL